MCLFVVGLAMQVEQAQDTTDKRRQMETEKEITSDLVEKYKVERNWCDLFGGFETEEKPV